MVSADALDDRARPLACHEVHTKAHARDASYDAATIDAVSRDCRAGYPCRPTGSPWKPMLWMGHKRIDETMLYVQFAEVHMRPVPEVITAAGHGIDDPDRRVIAMLSARQLAARWPLGPGVNSVWSS
jgi:hypothetical protein